MKSFNGGKFLKGARTSSIISEAIRKNVNVDIGDPSFTLLKTNVAPGY